MTASVRTLTPAQARRVAVAAQLLAAPAPTGRAVDRGHLRRLVRHLGLLQMDSVNVLARAHLLPPFARLGDYPVDSLLDMAWPARERDRTLFEAWAHEASLVPVELYPLLRWQRRHWSSRVGSRLRAEHPEIFDRVLAVLDRDGPLSAGQVEERLATGVKGRAGWWEWSLAKRACEGLFASGEIATAFRRGFERYYDLTERVLPAAVRALPTVPEDDAKRELVAIAARAHGVGTAKDLADYFRMPVADTRAALADLVDAGVVEEVAVAGWRAPAFLHTAARLPRTVDGRALLCPFDPLIWARERTERLFGVHYRIEIYTPAEQRVHGYYVLPFLLGDQLAARFDLKTDRAAGALLVQAAWRERGTSHPPGEIAAAAATELHRMAGWLGTARVQVRERGDLWPALAQAVHASR